MSKKKDVHVVPHKDGGWATKTESRSFAVISPPPDCPVGTFMPMQHG